MRACFVSSLSTPMMNKFCDELNKSIDIKFVFYEEAVTRPKWWLNFEKAKNAIILEKGIKLGSGKYFNHRLMKELSLYDPDVLILGGFFIPSNWLAYKWAKRRNKKVIIYTEKLGYSADPNSRNKLTYSPFVKGLFKLLYNDIDKLLAVGDVGVNCYTEEFNFSVDKVKKTQYPVDMYNHLKHSLRNNSEAIVFLFPHRLIATYNPVMAISWFKAINKEHPNTSLKMNAFGAMRKEVEDAILHNDLMESVTFMDDISGWESLHLVYKSADVILSTKSAIKGDGDWSIAEMEAAASGLGFIITDSSIGLVNFLSQNNSGFVINDINDLDSVVSSANSYIKNEGLLKSHGRANQNSIKKYSIENSALTFKNVLNEL